MSLRTRLSLIETPWRWALGALALARAVLNSLVVGLVIGIMAVSATAHAEALNESVTLDPKQFLLPLTGTVSPGRHDFYSFRAKPGVQIAFVLQAIQNNAALQLGHQPAGDPNLRILRMSASGEQQVAVVSTSGSAHYKLDVFASDVDASVIIKQYYQNQQATARRSVSQLAAVSAAPPPPTIKPYSAIEMVIAAAVIALLGLLIWLGVRMGRPWAMRMWAKATKS